MSGSNDQINTLCLYAYSTFQYKPNISSFTAALKNNFTLMI